MTTVEAEHGAPLEGDVDMDIPKLFLPVLMFGLAGCTTTNEILAKQADEVFHTADAPEQVASCFARANHMRVIERPDGTRVAQFRNGYGGVVKAFSIYPEGSGSRIEARHSAISVPGMKWRRCVGVTAR